MFESCDLLAPAQGYAQMGRREDSWAELSMLNRLMNLDGGRIWGDTVALCNTPDITM